MTLLYRLILVALLGVAIFFGYVYWGEPMVRAMQAQQQSPDSDTPQAVSRLYGEYRAETASGRYTLILDAKGSELRFIDKQKRDYAYRGHYIVDGATLELNWTEQRSGQTWAAMKPVADKMQIKSADAISTAEATFNRIGK